MRGKCTPGIPVMGLSGAFSVIQEEDRVEWKDGKCRCCWANPKNERYIRYHDEDGDARFMMTESCLNAGFGVFSGRAFLGMHFK